MEGRAGSVFSGGAGIVFIRSFKHLSSAFSLPVSSSVLGTLKVNQVQLCPPGVVSLVGEGERGLSLNRNDEQKLEDIDSLLSSPNASVDRKRGGS